MREIKTVQMVFLACDFREFMSTWNFFFQRCTKFGPRENKWYHSNWRTDGDDRRASCNTTLLLFEKEIKALCLPFEMPQDSNVAVLYKTMYMDLLSQKIVKPSWETWTAVIFCEFHGPLAVEEFKAHFQTYRVRSFDVVCPSSILTHIHATYCTTTFSPHLWTGAHIHGSSPPQSCCQGDRRQRTCAGVVTLILNTAGLSSQRRGGPAWLWWTQSESCLPAGKTTTFMFIVVNFRRYPCVFM